MNSLTDQAKEWMVHAGKSARAASDALARTPEAVRNRALTAIAAELRSPTAQILAPTAAHLAQAEGSPAFLDRLQLTESRIEAIAQGLGAVAALPDPLARVLAEWTRPNGLRIQRIATPIGVIGMIYESRPNVGVDAAGLCLKSGNAVILRGGSESARSAAAINGALQKGLEASGLPKACVQIAPSSDRAFV